MLPILYKLFSRIVYSRMRPVLERAQKVDQAGFRSGFSCDDHLLAITVLIETLAEYNLPLWICAIDFEKAFDSIEHPYLWKSLLEQGVEPQYVRVLAAMYEGQCGHILGGALSRPFVIGRGTKQGDPMSPGLFNAALEKVFGNIVGKWRAKGWGVPCENSLGDTLTNLRFADDVLLVASSKKTNGGRSDSKR